MRSATSLLLHTASRLTHCRGYSYVFVGTRDVGMINPPVGEITYQILYGSLVIQGV